MKKLINKYAILIFLYTLLLTAVSYQITHSFFSDVAASSFNTFSAAQVFPTITQTPPAPGDVVINEILWMGSSVNSSDEWIELRNMTSNTIDLSNWAIDNLGSGSNNVIIPPGKSILPNGFFLIANDPKETGAHNIDPDLVTNLSIKNNPSEQLILRVASSGAIIDTADDNISGWFAGITATGQNPDKSMERNFIPGDGTLSANWHTATISANIDAGSNTIATPKTANSGL